MTLHIPPLHVLHPDWTLEQRMLYEAKVRTDKAEEVAVGCLMREQLTRDAMPHEDVLEVSRALYKR